MTNFRRLFLDQDLLRSQEVGKTYTVFSSHLRNESIFNRTVFAASRFTN